MEKNLWLVYAILAGLAWGTYVPFVQQGILGFNRNSIASFLCVGIAYFLIAILFPLGMFAMDEKNRPAMDPLPMYGITFATLAGVAGAVGALCVILANRAVPKDGDYRMYIAPIIFALAPVLNALISSVWHAKPGDPFHFALQVPNMKLIAGIVLTGIGASLVLYSKEEAEQAAKQKAAAAKVAPASLDGKG